MSEMICPLFNDANCRFLSQERQFIPITALIENPKTKRLELGATCIKTEVVGAMCNNISQWVKDLKYCPARWGLHSVPATGMKADGCGTYSDSYGQSLIPQDDIFLVVGAGQQTLGSVIEI